MNADRHLGIRLTAAEWEALAKIAARQEESVSAMVREALYRCYRIGELQATPAPCKTPTNDASVS